MNNTNLTHKIIYGTFITIIVGLVAYIMITQPKVKAGNEVLEIQQEIKQLEQSIKEHKAQYDNALKEKDNCIQQCTTSWENQAAIENKWADADRAKIASLNDRLGLILESVKLQ